MEKFFNEAAGWKLCLACLPPILLFLVNNMLFGIIASILAGVVLTAIHRTRIADHEYMIERHPKMRLSVEQRNNEIQTSWMSIVLMWILFAIALIFRIS